MRRSSFWAVALGATLAAAALLRFWGLSHGIPFAIGVDEPEVMARAVAMIKTGDFNPHFYDYPGLYIYLQAAIASVHFLVGAMRGQWSSLAQASTADFYVWGRAVTASLGTASVWVLYRAGLRWNHATALLGAALFAVMPLHVRESHFVLTDVPTTFFVVLTLLLSLRAYERPTLGRFVLAGVAAGLAGATKYNGIFAGIMPVIAWSGAPPDARGNAARLWSMLAAIVIAFLLAAPYTLLDLPNFLNAFAHLSSVYQGEPARAHAVMITSFKELRNALDWKGLWFSAVPVGPASVLAIVAVALGVWHTVIARGARVRWACATIFPLLYFWFVSRQALHFARYLLPAVPFVSLLTAAAVVEIVARLGRARAAVGTALIAVALVPSFVNAVAFDADQSKLWTLEQAYDWIRQAIPEGAHVRLEGHALLLPAEYHPTYANQLAFDNLDDDAARGVEYLVASSEIYGLYERNPAGYPEQYAAYQRLFARTRELARFTPSRTHPGPELRILKLSR